MRARLQIAAVAIIGLFLGVMNPAAAAGGDGSVVTGVLWEDADGDGARGAPELEPALGGATVELLSAVDGAVIATAVTDPGGSYTFSDLADGAYAVRAAAPDGLRFSDAFTEANDFVRTGEPGAGEPERGISGQISIAEGSIVAGLDGALQRVASPSESDTSQEAGGEDPEADADAPEDAGVPADQESEDVDGAQADDGDDTAAPQTAPLEITAAAAEDVTLDMRKLGRADACDGFATTGQPPFDAVDGPGQDSGPANCIVRLNDLVVQDYGVSLTGLGNGESVSNIVVEFTLRPTNGGKVAFAGPGAGGMPGECLGAANGANPPSQILAPAADGSVTLRCNIGSMTSNVAGIQVAYKFLNNTPLPATVELSAFAYAAQGGAGNSETVTGPVVTATGAAEWELRKSVYGYATSPSASNPRYIVRNGQPGYSIRYMFEMQDMLAGKGADLLWPVSFHDAMPDFPNAVVGSCQQWGFWEGGPYPDGHNWTISCPVGQTQGPDGWQISIGKGTRTPTLGRVLMDVWIPAEDLYRKIDPTWQPGMPIPTGSYDFDNVAKDTDTWTINGGQLNYLNGQEPGYDGTGDNVAAFAGEAKEPRWDLQKFVQGNPSYQIVDIDGTPTEGYTQRYLLRVTDLTGSPNLAPFLDEPLTFKDKFFVDGQFAAEARLTGCSPVSFTIIRSNNSSSATTGTPTCTTGAQPGTGDDMDTGWELTFHPNQWAYDLRRADMFVDIFVPLDEFEVDPCTDLTVNLEFKNMAVQSDGWTMAGLPMNGTGFEPGWDGAVATGNNVVTNRPNFSSQCGTLRGEKLYTNWADGQTGGQTWPGRILGSQVHSWADNARVEVANYQLCDVFDVSTLKLAPPRNVFPRFVTVNTPLANLDAADYVIEYAVGPNAVDTQAGPIGANGQYPLDASSLDSAASSCRTHTGPWLADPSAFGAGWEDRVNMVRVRPIDPATVASGPFDAYLQFELESRYAYNGGPNAGEPIPTGVLARNDGAFPTGADGSVWQIQARNIVTREPLLELSKAVEQATYLPGDRIRWFIAANALYVSAGQVIDNVRIVDTIPQGLTYDAACTQAALPPGVTVSYNPGTRQVTFSAGDMTMTTNVRTFLFNTPANSMHPRLTLCTTASTLAQPGDIYRNTVSISADNATSPAPATAQARIVGAGQLGIDKQVDKPYVGTGEPYTWTLTWGNSSTVITMQAPDLIDVLPWTGDGDAGSLSARSPAGSDYVGTAVLTGPLAAPTYTVGGTGVGNEVTGTWYYSTAAPSTINHDPRDPSNASPADPGGRWRTAAEISDFSAVTAVRFVSGGPLTTSTSVRTRIEMVSTSSTYGNYYVNRAQIYTPTFPDQPLLSNQPYTMIPGFSLGDLVWIDANFDGRYQPGEVAPAGVAVQVLDEDGVVVGTATTNDAGRWSVDGLPPGTYRARIPAAEFQQGGPLAGLGASPSRTGDGLGANEGTSNNNTPTDDVTATGLTSTPLTLAYRYTGQGDDRRLAGGNATGFDTAGLAPDLLPTEFGEFTVDLALAPVGAVDIEKYTNTFDADTPTGPNIAVGDPVRWTYVVTNTGDTDLHDVTVTDDQVAADEIDCDGTGSNVIAGPLAPGDTFTCVATGIATVGQYANTGSVAGSEPDGVDGGGAVIPGAVRTDDDPSHYFGAQPAVDIEKATNGQDADTPTGPLVTVGGAVQWTYVVTNTGNVPLTNVTVTDDQVAADEIDCAGTGGNVIAGPLAPEASFTCIATGVATLGQYANLGTVVGTGPETSDVDGNPVVGEQVTDEDPSHYLGVAPAVDIEKFTNGQDADEPPGVQTSEGALVVWAYVVTNTGNVPLTDVTVTDDQVAADDIDCAGSGSNTIAGPLAPGEGFICVATGTAIRGQYANLGTVVGTGPETTDVDGDPVVGQEVTDDDPSHYFGNFAQIDIEKFTNGEDADTPTGPFILADGTVEWTYVVTNTGTVDLYEVAVTDDQVDATDIDCDETGSNVVPGPLAPGASFTCVATGTAITGQYANVGDVVGEAPDLPNPQNPEVPLTVTDDDPSHYFGAVPEIDIEKHTNGQDADTAPGVPLMAGALVEWTYIVTNTGNVPLTDVTVTDDRVAASEIRCAGGDSNVVAGPLAPGESFTCNAFGTALVGPYVNLGTVIADVPGLDMTVTDDDPSHYTASAPAALPTTGGAVPIAALVVGGLLTLLGLVVVGIRRRRTT